VSKKHRSRIAKDLSALSNDTTTNFGTEQHTQAVDPVTGWTAEETAAVADEQGNVEVPALDEVDTPEALDDEAEDVAVPDGEGAKPATEKVAKAPARVAPPEGYITPVAFAKVLTEHLSGKKYQNKNGFVGRAADGATVDLKVNPIPPQYIYSMINQGNKPNAKNPVPTYVSAHDGQVYKTGEQPEGVALARVNLMDATEALAWWDAKDERVAASRQAKAEKAAKAAEKAAAAPAVGQPANEAPSAPVEEAE
jgi:hypothetical protein